MKLNRTILPFVSLAVVIACSEQGEGDRCIAANGNSDCGSGLICVKAQELDEWERNVSAQRYVADRCCPPSGNADPKCDRRKPSSSSSAGGAVGSDSGGDASGGVADGTATTASSSAEIAGSSSVGQPGAGAPSSSRTSSTEPAGAADTAGSAGAAGSSVD